MLVILEFAIFHLNLSYFVEVKRSKKKFGKIEIEQVLHALNLGNSPFWQHYKGEKNYLTFSIFEAFLQIFN